MLFRSQIQTLRTKLQALGQVDFVRSVGVLAGGTALAQGIAVLALPLVTRLYSPGDFSVLAVYSAVLGILGVVACLRLEIAIPLPENDAEAANLLALALCSSAAVSVLLALIVWVWPMKIVQLLDQPGLQPFLWMFPLGIWLASTYAAVQFWATRKKRFTAIAKTRMTQSLGGVAVKLGLGLWQGFGALGLLLGQLIATGAGVFGLCRHIWQDDRTALSHVSWQGMRKALIDYQRFPKFSMLESFANNAAIQLPIIIIAATAIKPDAGYLMLATQAVSVPMSLIGGAVSQVYLSRAPDEFRAGNLGPFTAQVIAGLVKTGVGPIVFIGMTAPVLFPLVFGGAWQRAGEMVAWMTPWFVMQFLSSPVSMTLHVTGNQKAALWLQISGLFFRVGSVIFALTFFNGFIFEVYAVSGVIFYITYFGLILMLAKVRFIFFVKHIATGMISVSFWCLAGVFVYFIFMKF